MSSRFFVVKIIISALVTYYFSLQERRIKVTMAAPPPSSGGFPKAIPDYSGPGKSAPSHFQVINSNIVKTGRSQSALFFVVNVQWLRRVSFLALFFAPSSFVRASYVIGRSGKAKRSKGFRP